MAEKDITEKTLEAYNDVFADIVNVLLMNGEPVIGEDELIDDVSRSHYKVKDKIHEQERDVAKFWKSNNIRIAFMGLENQTEPDPDMPLRVMSYDGATYRSQLIKKSSKFNDKNKLHKTKKYFTQTRFPTITLVLYFGYRKRWNKPQNLLGCISVPEMLKPYVNDYKINLFEIAYLSEETIKSFKSDFRFVADYFYQMQKNNEYVPSKESITHVQAVLEMMSALTKDKRFEEVCNSSEEGEVKNMCEVLDRIEARGEARGEALFAKLTSKLLEAGRVEDLQKALEDKEYRKQLYMEYGLL